MYYDLCNMRTVRELMEKYSVGTKKSFGQNFLVNPSVPERIAREAVSRAGSPCGVIEIGPGAGALTQFLAQEFDRVVAVELDRGLIPLLGEALGEYRNVAVVEGDFLKTDLPAFISDHFSDLIRGGGTVGICANLPYYITSPVIMKIMESFDPAGPMPLAFMTFMVQTEVARRLAAKAGSPDYGAITASIALRADVEKLFDVSPGNFMPPPKVTSSVVMFRPHEGIRKFPGAPGSPDRISEFDGRVRELISLAFGMRRKTLVNALLSKYAREDVTDALEKAGFRPDIRGEKLSAADFCMLASYLSGPEKTDKRPE